MTKVFVKSIPSGERVVITRERHSKLLLTGCYKQVINTAMLSVIRCTALGDNSRRATGEHYGGGRLRHPFG